MQIQVDRTVALCNSWGAGCSYTVGSMADGCTVGLGSGGKPDKHGGLLQQEHMAVQVRSSCNIVLFVRWVKDTGLLKQKRMAVQVRASCNLGLFCIG